MDEIPFDSLGKVSKDLYKLITAFLVRDVKKRLGVREMGGLDGIREQSIFKGTNWDLIAEKKIVPPFVPNVPYD